MITQVSHVVFYVNDIDEALSFYKDILGFKIHTDVTFQGKRFLSIQAPEQKELEIMVMKAESAESKALVGKQSPDVPLFVMTTTDCKGDFETLKKKNIVFVQEPTQRPWGLAANFKDLYGNVIHLVQP